MQSVHKFIYSPFNSTIILRSYCNITIEIKSKFQIPVKMLKLLVEHIPRQTAIE